MKSIKLDNFKFFTDPPWDEKEVFRTLIPGSVNGKEELLKYCASLLHVGGYFGNNWDAFDEVIKDLSWIKNKKIQIVHDNLPDIEEKDLLTYLEILSDAIDFWKQNSDGHVLEVYFPDKSKYQLAKVVS